MAVDPACGVWSSKVVVAGRAEPRCYIRVNGGFGNQLFQYAVARHLRLAYGIPATLDISAYRRAGHLSVAHQRLCLDQFGLPIEMTSLPVWRYEVARKLHKFPGLLQRLLTGIEFRKERHQPDFAAGDAWGRIVINGTWQSPKWFAASSATISDEIRTGLGVSDKIQPDTVSFHVRRGDYLSVDYMARLDYQRLLENARQHLRSDSNRNWRFKIFSDDPQWCRDTLTGDDVEIHDSGPMLDDFREMLSCEHNIIANSTFSWWAAYLNPNPNKITYAPTRWLVDRTSHQIEILPAEWIQLDDT